MEKNDNYYEVGSMLRRIKPYFHYMTGNWWGFLFALLLGLGVGLIYYRVQKPKYEAECTFIVEENQGSMGGISGLASQFGLDIGGITSGGSLFAGDNVLDILKSRKIVDQVLLSPKFGAAPNGETLADLFLEFSGMRKEWKDKPEVSKVNFTAQKGPLTKLQDSILNIIYDKLTTKYLSSERINKKGTIIKVNVTATNDTFAKATTERLVDEASKMYLTIKTGTAQENISRMQRRSDSLLYLLNRKSYSAAAAQPLDINPGIRELVVPTEIASRDKAVIATLYAEVTKNLEASKLLLSQQTPVIQIIDRPGLSLYDNKRKLWVLMLAGAVIAEVFCFFLLSGIYAIKTLKKM